jgi:hypothetical protein
MDSLHSYAIRNVMHSFSVVMLVALPLQYFGQTDAVYTISEGERRIAFHFQSALNTYRQDADKDTLVWNEELYNAALNHTNWMIQCNKVSYSESKGDSIYTGKTVEDRINYITKRNDDLLCRENVIVLPFDLDGTDQMSDDEAWMIADLAFENWMMSKYDKENMYNNYLLHSGAFRYVDGYVWASSIFCCEGDE